MRVGRAWIVVVSVVVVALVAVPRASSAASGTALSPSVQGGGSGFAALEIDQWRADVAGFGLDVGYVAQGSTFGQQQFISGAFDFAATDYAFTADQLADLSGGRCAGIDVSSCFDAVPVSAAGLAFMFNVADGDGNRVTTLNLTRQVACKIFTGAIAKWNDPAIVATNPDLATFDRAIRPVVHAEGSGTSFWLSQYCIAVAPAAWSSFVLAQKNGGFDTVDSAEFNAGQPTRDWPEQGWSNTAVPVTYDDGVASFVEADANTIAVVPAGYALVRQVPVANVENASGHFVAPDSVNATIGLSYGTETVDGSFTPDFDGADPRTYQPVGLSWIVAPIVGFDAAKGRTLGRFLCWAVAHGQRVAPQLGYAPLPTGLRAVAVDAIERIPGAPDATTCAAEPPDGPGNVHARAHGHTVDVSWSAPNAHGLAITAYHVIINSSVADTRLVSVAPTHASFVVPAGWYSFNVFASSAAGTGDWSPPSNTVRVVDAQPQPRHGYWMLGADGHVYAFGDAPKLGSAPGRSVAMAPRRDGKGYWITDAAGNVARFGTATAHGTRPTLNAGERVSTIAATPGNGYWLFTNRGRAFGSGDAKFYGDLRRRVLNGPIVASVATPTGHGYYMVGSDGGVFGFGDPRFHGSTGNIHLNKPVVGISPTPDNRGYWLVASDGGVFAFDAPFRGSMGATRLNRPVNGLVAYGNGYLMVASDGGVFDFADTAFLGSLAADPPSAPIIGIAAFAT